MDNLFDDKSAPGEGFDFRSLLKEIWRRKWLFFIPFVLCLSMAGLAIKTMTPLYYSWGQIQVRTDFFRSQLLNDPTGNLGGRNRNLDGEIKAEMETLLTSPEFLDNIVRELGMQKNLMARSLVGAGPPLDEPEAVRRTSADLAKRLRLELEGRHLYRIGVIDTDPQEAYDLTRFILDRFLEEYRKMRLAPRASTRNFLIQQKEIYQQDLDRADQELNEFLVQLSSTGLVGNPINANNLGLVEERLNRAQDRHNGSDALEMAGLEKSALPVLGALPAVDTYAKDSEIKALTQELTDLGVEMMTPLDGSYSDDAEMEMGRMRVQINNRVEELVTLNHPNLGLMDRNRLSQYIYFSLYSSVERAVIGRAAVHIRNYRQFLNQQPLQSSQLAELQSKVLHYNELVLTIENEITQQRMNLEAGMSDVGIQVSIPAEPNKLKLAFMGFVLSVGIGTGLLVLALFLDKSFKTVAGIESALGLPVLGTLPQIKFANLEPRRRLRLLFWLTIVLGILAVGSFGFLVIYPKLSL